MYINTALGDLVQGTQSAQPAMPPPAATPDARRADYTLAAKLAFGAAAIGVLLYWMDKKGY